MKVHLIISKCLCYGVIVVFYLLFMGCEQPKTRVVPPMSLEQFIGIYNQQNKDWLEKSLQETEAAIQALNQEDITIKDEAARQRREATLKTLLKEKEVHEFRLNLGNYFQLDPSAKLPDDLVWQDGMDQPEIGDSRAQKGGVWRRFIDEFPPTIRPFGVNSNHSFRGDLYDFISMPLVSLHPETMKEIPAIAKKWAISKDQRTVYFKLNPEATYSDGVKIKARDFLYAIFLQVSDYNLSDFIKKYFRENIAQIILYDEETLAVTLPQAKMYAAATAGMLSPQAPHFYKEYGPDYAERYQWAFPPTTGAYEVKPSGLVKGVSITQTRVKNWWARDLKYYRYRFNPDQIQHRVIRDITKAFEYFRAGELDSFLLSEPQYWYEKSEIAPVYDGMIEKVTFYRNYPKVPRGLYVNVTKPLLKEKGIREGIQYAMNMPKIIQTQFRGDATRLNAFNEGYVLFSDPSIRARPYSIQQARACFAAMGFTQEGKDGILKNTQGERLSVGMTYPVTPMLDRIFSILKEEAKKCGLELRLEGLEGTVFYKKIMQKQHEMVYASWLTVPPVPSYHQFLHSSMAFDAKGNPLTQTNNLFLWGRSDTDVLCNQVDKARDENELRDASWKLQHIIHDEAIFIPTWSVDFIRIGHWRWMRWPESETTSFAPRVCYDPHETFVFWIDEGIKQQTLSAKQMNKKFPESTKTYFKP